MAGLANLVYVGTYTAPGKSKGMYVLRLDASTGALEQVHVVEGVVNPSWLGFAPGQRFLFAVNELHAKEDGAVSSFAVDQQTGNLSFVSQQPTHGGDPCHLAVDASGRYVVVANHEHGNVAVVPVDADGRLGPATDIVQHHGSGPGPTQQGPHAHCASFDPAGRVLMINDKGIDKVMLYRLDTATGKLRPNDPPWGETPSGAAPRHLTFHPSGRYAYVNGEADMTINVFAYDAGTGALTFLQRESTLPAGYTSSGRDSTAQIVCHNSGRAVYVSNRGHDSIAMFSIEAGTGRVAPIGHVSTGGRTPRNFNIDPSGQWLLACNQQSDTIVTFRVDPVSGRLEETGKVAQVPTPVCVLFAR